MNTSRVRNWLEIIAVFGVISSLIFVGLEMRQSQKIALSAAYQARADSSMNLRMAALQSETLQSASAKLRQGKGYEELTPEEMVVMNGRWNAALVYLENMHFQYLNEFISEEHWQTNRAELTGMLGRNAYLRRRIVENCAVFRESFCEEIKAAVARIDSEE
jgi:hypothetical protein